VGKLVYANWAPDRSRDEPGASNRLYEAGRSTAAAMLGEVGPLFRGRRMAIEIGCGVGHVLLGHAGSFERLRGVDVEPDRLAKLEERAARTGITNVQGFLTEQPWDEPTGVADFVYSEGVFQYIEDRIELASYLQRISVALRRGGIAQLQFDTRPRTLPYQAGRYLPDRLLAPNERRGVRSIRRDPAWVWHRLRGADLEVFGEWGHWTDRTWFVARRR
jgi:hypothetical protein